MKLLREDYVRDGSGAVDLLCEVADDVWTLYNIIYPSDRVKTDTTRKVQKESATGTVSTEVKRLTLNLNVKKTDYEGEGDVLRISGQVVTENPFVKIGAYHTLEITVKSKLTLYKDSWDRLVRDKLQDAVDPHRKADVQVVLIESGFCQVFLLSDSLAKRVAKVQRNIPKHRGPSSDYEKAKKRFFNEVFSALVLHTNFNAVKCVLIAGPGFTKDEFLRFMHEEAQRRDCRAFISNKKMFVVAAASTAQKHALSELLEDGAVSSLLQNAKAVRHAQRLQEFYRLLNATFRSNSSSSSASIQDDSPAAAPSMTCYGLKQVYLAVQGGAVRSLLITDGLLRTSSVKQRKLFVQMVDEVERAGGEVLVLSDQHSSGEQLNMLAGVAAILKFPLWEEEINEEEDNFFENEVL